MFANLDTLPADKHYFTVYVSTQPEDTPRDECEADELDIIAPAFADWSDVVNKGTAVGYDRPAQELLLEMYGIDMIVVGVVNQSIDYVVFDHWRDSEQV